MADPPKKPDDQIQAGADIPPPQPEKVFEWLAERINLTRVVGAAVSWLNLQVFVRLLMSDGTVQVMPAKTPKISSKNSTLELDVDLTNFTGGGVFSIPLWIPGTTAAADTVWALQSGPAQGLYYCTANGNTNSPDSGINWIQISSALGVWQ
jgi:hypothetical protein